MLDSSKQVLLAMEITNTCRELQAICIGYKDTNLELFNYYNSFLKFLRFKHKFVCSEAKKAIDLQNHIWEKERIERENSKYYLEGERLTNESKKPTLTVEREPTKITVKTTYKELIGKVSEFTIFGYKFFFCFEVGKVA